MTRQAIKSSMLKSVGYDPQKKELEVEFKDGSVYSYKNVPPSKAAGFLSAPSIGQYMQAHIIGNHPHTKI